MPGHRVTRVEPRAVASARRRPGAWLSSFARRHGWRAYALPVLLALTIAALAHGTTDAVSDHRAAGDGGTSPRSVAGATVTREGVSAADFRPGSTPAPVVVDLGEDTASCAANTVSRRVIVSVRRQHMWVCARHRQVDSTPVTTGAAAHGNGTPLGSWRVQSRERDRYLVGPGYRDYVRFWLPFNGEFGLHDASWQTIPFGSPDYRTSGSHGCVHVPTTTMSWLYRWAQTGLTVVTVEA